jgi:H+/Cl- antiporter ClcA
MFSSDFFWSQVWKVMLGAVACIIGIIIYAVLQFVDIAVMYANKFLAYWLLRALLLVVVLWCIGQFIYWLRGWGNTDTHEQTDGE